MAASGWGTAQAGTAGEAVKLGVGLDTGNPCGCCGGTTHGQGLVSAAGLDVCVRLMPGVLECCQVPWGMEYDDGMLDCNICVCQLA